MNFFYTKEVFMTKMFLVIVNQFAVNTLSIMEDQACPRCKTTKYRNPSLKLMVNICGHTLCESCVDLLFLKGIFIFY